MKERDYQWGISASNKKRVLGVLGFLEVTTIIMVRENDNTERFTLLLFLTTKSQVWDWSGAKTTLSEL